MPNRDPRLHSWTLCSGYVWSWHRSRTSSGRSPQDPAITAGPNPRRLSSRRVRSWPPGRQDRPSGGEGLPLHQRQTRLRELGLAVHGGQRHLDCAASRIPPASRLAAECRGGQVAASAGATHPCRSEGGVVDQDVDARHPVQHLLSDRPSAPSWFLHRLFQLRAGSAPPAGLPSRSLGHSLCVARTGSASTSGQPPSSPPVSFPVRFRPVAANLSPNAVASHRTASATGSIRPRRDTAQLELHLTGHRVDARWEVDLRADSHLLLDLLLQLVGQVRIVPQVGSGVSRP